MFANCLLLLYLDMVKVFSYACVFVFCGDMGDVLVIRIQAMIFSSWPVSSVAIVVRAILLSGTAQSWTQSQLLWKA